MLLKLLEILRIAGVSVAFGYGYQLGFQNGSYNPAAQLHGMTPLILLAIAGTSGLEGLLFPNQAAKAKGFETGSNYQRQSAIALLSYAVMGVVVAAANWGLQAELTILLAFLFFCSGSAINHGMAAIRQGNHHWQNINRPVLTLLLIAGLAYPVVQALRSLAVASSSP
jgi:hypothetical protein